MGGITQTTYGAMLYLRTMCTELGTETSAAEASCSSVNGFARRSVKTQHSRPVTISPPDRHLPRKPRVATAFRGNSGVLALITKQTLCHLPHCIILLRLRALPSKLTFSSASLKRRYSRHNVQLVKNVWTVSPNVQASRCVSHILYCQDVHSFALGSW